MYSVIGDFSVADGERAPSMCPSVVIAVVSCDHGQVWDKTELQRTLFFPGLGWLLTRKLYEEVGPDCIALDPTYASWLKCFWL